MEPEGGWRYRDEYGRFVSKKRVEEFYGKV
jgi:hypothetical protein